MLAWVDEDEEEALLHRGIARGAVRESIVALSCRPVVKLRSMAISGRYNQEVEMEVNVCVWSQTKGPEPINIR